MNLKILSLFLLFLLSGCAQLGRGLGKLHSTLCDKPVSEKTKKVVNESGLPLHSHGDTFDFDEGFEFNLLDRFDSSKSDFCAGFAYSKSKKDSKKLVKEVNRINKELSKE